ncbi:MAG: phage major capsid protein [Verrucomicrobiia bacterium]|jgi:HK97 family phage major capsid protein
MNNQSNENKINGNVLDDIVQSVSELESTVLNQYERLDKETKAALEEFTLLKNRVDDQTAILNSLKRAQIALRNEHRAAFGDPIKRIAADEEKTQFINAAVRKLCSAPLSETHKKALGEDTSPGSTYITNELASDIYDLLSAYGQWSTLGVRRLGTKTTSFPVKTDRPNAVWISTEGSQIAEDSSKAGTSVELTVKLIAVLINVSRQLIEDSEFDITAEVLNDFAEACSYRLDWSAFMGNGLNNEADGGFIGIFNGGRSAQAANGHTTIDKLTLEDITKCLTTVAPAVLQRKACWWIHPHNLVRILHIKDQNGRPLFLSSTEAPAPGGIGTILGYPVILCNVAPYTDGADKQIAVFGDPQGCVVGIRSDFEFASSDHHHWDYYQRSFRGVVRGGVKIRNQDAFAVLKTSAT